MIPHQNDLVTFQHDAKYALNGRMEFKEGTMKVLKLEPNHIYRYFTIKSIKSKSKMNLPKNKTN